MQPMEWIFRVGYIFVLIWTFGLATNGVKRNTLIATGGVGALAVLLLSVIASIVSRSLLFVGVLFELSFVFLLSLLVFGYLFRHISKP